MASDGASVCYKAAKLVVAALAQFVSRPKNQSILLVSEGMAMTSDPRFPAVNSFIRR
jgi:hypothetical protein